jgi:hypothetical protein
MPRKKARINPSDAKGNPIYETPLGLGSSFDLSSSAGAGAGPLNGARRSLLSQDDTESDRAAEEHFNKLNRTNSPVFGDPQELIGRPDISKRQKSRSLVLDHGWRVADAARALGIRYQMVYNYTHDAHYERKPN